MTKQAEQPEQSTQAAVAVSKQEVIYALEHDAEFFIQFFLGDELTLEVPDFHPEIFNLMIERDVKQFACAIPRDHAKTTLAKLTCVHYFLFSKYNFILYMSNVVSIAIPSTNDIINFFLCDNFKAVFGEIQFITRQDGKGIYAFKLGDKVCILRAHGAGMQVRGINILHQRPQLAICDDIEDSVNNATPELFQKLKKWFYGPFKKALNKFDHKIIHIGNLTENETLIAEHCQSRFWHSRVYGCLLSDGKPLWPDAWPIEKLRQDYNEYREAGMADVWFAEMMNMPTAGGRGVIRASEIFYQPQREPDDIEFGFITIDLAISEASYAHETVVCVHGYIPDAGDAGLWQIVEYRGFKGIDPISLFWKVMELADYWRILTIGIEDVAYQASLKHVFRHECLRSGIQQEGDHGITFVPLSASGRKAQRIIAWAAMVKAKEYALNEGDFSMTQQLITYRPDKKHNKDDYIDAAAYGPQMLDRFLYLIMRRYQISVNGATKSSYQLCCS